MRVVATILKYNDKILILKRGENAPWMPNKWNLPGGMVDPGEDLKTAATRECQEETGITPKNLNFLTKLGKSVYIFVGETNSPNVKIDYESSSFAWIGKNDVNKYTFVPGIKKLIISQIVGIL